MKGEPTTLHDFEPETAEDIVERIQSRAFRALEDSEVSVDV